MKARVVLLLLVALAVPACGGSGTRTAAAVRACVAKRLPRGAVDRVTVSTVEGVTTIDYERGGSDTVVTVFPSIEDAQHGMVEEARMGDAHDMRTRNVLHSGGGAAEAAVVACLR